MAELSIRGVKKTYGNIEVLHGIDLDIAEGEFVAFVGPSGCGKTTLLRMIAGLETITSGEIRIGERVVNNVPAKDRDIAMVFQNYALYPHKTVRQNIAFALKLRRQPKSEIERRIRDAAEILQLGPLLDRYPDELSGGQRQRVAMARAIVREPKVFLFDEPLSNLDAKLRVSMRSEIKELHRRLGTTIIYVTHDQIEAMTMADRVVLLRGGRIDQAAPPLDLYDRPANRHVATFIGSPAMNLIDGQLETEDFVLPDGQRMVLGAATTTIGRRSGPIVLGVRPEDLIVTDDDSGDWTGTVISLEPTGSETIVKVSMANESLTVLMRERRRLELGQKIGLKPVLDHTHLFDSESGMALR